MPDLRTLGEMAAAVALAARRARQDRWPSPRREARRAARLGALVRFAARRTRLYADLYGGLDLSDPIDLRRLPETSKRLLMERFDDGLSDRRLSHAGVMRHAAALSGDGRLPGGSRLIATTGTSGFRGYFVHDRAAWIAVLADTLRWNAMIGLRPRLGRRVRIAAIGADTPLHVSSRVALSGDAGLFRILRLSASETARALGRALVAFEPDALVGYPSVLAALALEAAEGRLAVAPAVVATHGETLTEGARARIRKAWGVEPFDHYGLTEAPHVAAECPEHRGLHVFEDDVIVEPVAADGAPVPPGEPAARWLLTNLANRVQPIIRYAVEDRLTMAAEPCPCGRPGRRIAAIEGRREDVLRLPAAAGNGVVDVSPHAVSLAVEAIQTVAEYAVRQSGATVRCDLVPRRGACGAEVRREAAAALATAFRAAGAAPEAIVAELVDALPRGADGVGKRRLVRGDPAASPAE